jgi:hypothetical protein
MLSSQIGSESQWLLLKSETPKTEGKTDEDVMENTTNDNKNDLSHRSLDEYFELAYNFNQHHFIRRWKYVRMVLALGLCSIGDATEMLSVGYVLSDPIFQQKMMHYDMNKNGALITSSITAGMIVGALLVRSFLLLFSFIIATQLLLCNKSVLIIVIYLFFCRPGFLSINIVEDDGSF